MPRQAGLHKDDGGNERNQVKTFKVVGIDTPEADPFAPAASRREGRHNDDDLALLASASSARPPESAGLWTPRAAFTAYASFDDRSKLTSEAYLSAFQFGDDFRQYLDNNRHNRGFDGVMLGAVALV